MGVGGRSGLRAEGRGSGAVGEAGAVGGRVDGRGLARRAVRRGRGPGGGRVRPGTAGTAGQAAVAAHSARIWWGTTKLGPDRETPSEKALRRSPSPGERPMATVLAMEVRLTGLSAAGAESPGATAAPLAERPAPARGRRFKSNFEAVTDAIRGR